MINGASAGVRIAEEGAVRGYAQQKKAQCVGTQSRRRRSAWVRSATEVQVRRHSESTRRYRSRRCVDTRRDRSRRCGATVEVRDAIEASGAELQYMYAAR